MVLVAPAPDWWVAFNPETCAIHKVWQGKVDFRGKVWDFSQDNSRARGRILYATPTEIWRLANDQSLPGWNLDGVKSEKGAWSFPDPTSKLSTPSFDASGWRKVFLSFDESGRKGRFQVDISDSSSRVRPQMFQSALSVGGETDFQFNFKRVERPTEATRISIHGLGPGKKLRNLRMYGDRSAWVDAAGRQLETVWGGYTLVGQTKAVWLRYGVKLADGRIVQIQHQPEVNATGWTEQFVVSNLPPGQKLFLRREGLSPTLKISTPLSFADRVWTFTSNGTFDIRFEVQESKK